MNKDPDKDYKYNVLLHSNYTKGKKVNLQELISSSNYLDTSYVNAIRRYAINNVKTLAFEYHQVPQNKDYIKFIKNTTNMNNDFIGHRIGLLSPNIASVKYLLLIYKILIGHHNTLDEINKKTKKNYKIGEEYKIYKEICSNLKISQETNMKLINEIVFYLDISNDLDLLDVTTLDIKLKLENEANISEKYMEKLTKYTNLINTYEKFTEINIRLENYKEDLLKYIFKPWKSKDGKEYGVLLCKLKKNEILRCEFILNDGCGEDHARWTTVCPINYTFEIDDDLVKENLLMKLSEANLLNENIEYSEDEELMNFIEERYKDIINFNSNETNINSLNEYLETVEEDKLENIKNFIKTKDDLLNIFNKCDKQRYIYGKDFDLYKRKFNLNIETNYNYPAIKIGLKSEKLLKKDLIGFINIIIDLLDNYSLFPINKDNITIDNSKKIINGIDIYYNNGSHSIGNILQSYIYNLIDDSILEYCGYKMSHPLKKEMLLTLGYSKNTSDMEVKTKEIFISLRNIFQNMNIKNFGYGRDEDDEEDEEEDE
tara:strand:+ start:752 stop:2380 length:1629 start_codon:yes stop_codon:yes gene_type:complete